MQRLKKHFQAIQAGLTTDLIAFSAAAHTYVSARYRNANKPCNIYLCDCMCLWGGVFCVYPHMQIKAI